ncbi:hypothetical protein N2152v2_004281 [Parachlorella kessleri]
MAGLDKDLSVLSLLSRFKGGRVALLAVKQALASTTSSSSTLHKDASGDSYTSDPQVEDHIPVDTFSAARSGSSFSHRSPHAVPQQLEVEYSQASHQSQQSQYSQDDVTQLEASWEEPYSPTLEQLSEPHIYGSRSPPREASVSHYQGQGGTLDTPELQQQDSPDEALLLCSALNTSCHPGVDVGNSPTLSPVALRLRGQLQRELSGVPLGSPMLARMVSEHSFEDGDEGPQARRSRLHVNATETDPDSSIHSCFASPTQPGPELDQAMTEAGHGTDMTAWPDWQAVGAEMLLADESTAPSEEGQEAGAPGNSRRLNALKKIPLHRARTPITAALAREQAASGFDDIPEGHATIPSSHLAPERPSAGPKAKPHAGGRQKSAAGAASKTCGKAHSQQRVLDSKLVFSSKQRLSQPSACVVAEDALQDVQGTANPQVQPGDPSDAVYSHDRFQQHFDRLSQLMARRQQRRQQQQDSLIEQVAGFEQTAARAPNQDAAESLAGCAAGAAEPKGREQQQGHGATKSPVAQHASPAVVDAAVKAEQDLALKYLGTQQRRYRASPLPLSSVEPRFADIMERAQERRAEAHEKRVELLRSQEQPFSFYERDKQRQKAALGDAGGHTGRSPAHSPTAFLANPIPVSTTEARYALLIAEMQLSNKALGRRSLRTSPATGASLRPATAGALQRPFKQQLLLLPRPASSQGCAATLGGASCRIEERSDGNQGSMAAATTQMHYEADVSAAVEPRYMVMTARSTAGAPGTLNGDRELALPEGSSTTGRSAGLAMEGLADRTLGNPLWQDGGLTQSYSCEWGSDTQGAPGPPRNSAAIGQSEFAASIELNAERDQQCGKAESLEEKTVQQQQEQQLSQQQHDCSLQGDVATCSGDGKATLLASSSPSMGTTRSQQLKLQAVQQSVASGRYATELERISASEQELKDMALLCSSPKWRRPGSAAVADSGPAAARRDSRAASALETATAADIAREELVGSNLPSGAVHRENLAGNASEAATGPGVHMEGQTNPWGDDKSGPECCATVDVYAAKHGTMLDAIDSPQSSSEPKWKLGTEVTLLAEEVPLAASGDRHPAGAAAGPPTVEKRKDTPLPHIAARHKQAEEAAKAEVRKVLLKRGVDVYNYVEGQP